LAYGGVPAALESRRFPARDQQIPRPSNPCASTPRIRGLELRVKCGRSGPVDGIRGALIRRCCSTLFSDDFYEHALAPQVRPNSPLEDLLPTVRNPAGPPLERPPRPHVPSRCASGVRQHCLRRCRYAGYWSWGFSGASLFQPCLEISVQARASVWSLMKTLAENVHGHSRDTIPRPLHFARNAASTCGVMLIVAPAGLQFKP